MDKLQTVLEELTALADGAGGDLAWFAQQMQDLRSKEIAPYSLPACALLKHTPDLANAQTRPVMQTICDAAPLLRWQQTYTEADGFSCAYLDAYGWFNLVSPEGIFINDTIRVSAGYLGGGLKYPQHWHEPEEFYLILAGKATFYSDDRTPRLCGPGDVVYHESNQKHSIEMTDGPFFAAAFWRGRGLLAKSGLEGSK